MGIRYFVIRARLREDTGTISGNLYTDNIEQSFLRVKGAEKREL